MTTPVASRDPSNRPAEPEDPTLLWIFAILVRDRRFVIGSTVLFFSLAVTMAILKNLSYTTTFSFVPQAAQDPNRSGLASLAGQFGISLGSLGGSSSQSPQLYADLVTTRNVLAPIAMDSYRIDPNSDRRISLPAMLGISGDSAAALERTLRVMRLGVVSTAVASRTTGVVTVRVTTRYPLVSYEIARRLLAGLNEFNLQTLQTQAREERRFTEKSLAAARAALRAVEDSAQVFYQGNRIGVETSPALRFQRDRLQGSVDLQRQVTSALAQQLEQARIREVRDTPVITVIEGPTIPALPNPRGRVVLGLMGIIGGFTLGLLIVLFREALHRQSIAGRDPAWELLSSEWSRITSMFRSRPKTEG